jgi:predicted DCC family thiol-disulfide oxidoreductase YuxK
MDHPVVIFDGVCNLCNASVRFIIRHDPEAVFRFAPLQSKAAQKLLGGATLPVDSSDSVLLVDGNNVYSESTAALMIARKLKGGWHLLYGLMIIPSPIRDAIYRLVARNRYRIFGKREQCMIPEPDALYRFLSS